MTSSRVLCLSTDEDFAARIAAPLEYSHPAVDVLTVSDVAEGVEVIEAEHVDAVVSDVQTVASSPVLFEAVRDRETELSLLLLSSYEDDASVRTAVAEVVDVVDDVGSDDGEEALAGWVANAVVSGREPSSPGGHDRMEPMVHSIKRALVDATDPVDVESAVCEQLVRSESFDFAWIGEYDRGEGQVVPWATAASGDPWPRTQSFAVDDGNGVVSQVLRTREPVVVDGIGDHLDHVPWRDVAVDRGCSGAAFVALYTDEELFGVLGAYTADPRGVTGADLEALEEIGSTTARVLEGMAIRGRIDQQERTLRRYRRLVETVDDGMYVLDDGGHFTTVNDALCAMTGYAREGLLGEHVGIVLDEDGLDDWLSEVDRLRSAGGESGSVDLAVRRKDGSTFPGENRVALLPSGEDGEFRGTVGVVRDVTERERRERELRRQNERLDAFASIVSHDLRNPLSVAGGYLEVLAEDVSHDAIEPIDDALARMNDMIDDVLALARGGKAVTDAAVVRLQDVAETAWTNVDTESASLSVEDAPTIVADRSRLLRAFENLFRNAVEHGGADVSVTVGGVDGAGPGDFYVEDDGPGMDPTVREHVFESDFTTSEDGHGIGLWVVGEVADAHGWTAEPAVGSEGGARFEFLGVEAAE